MENTKNYESFFAMYKSKELMMSKNKYYELVTHQANLENIYKEDVEIEEVAVNE